MKKLIALLLALTLMFALVACGNTTPPDTSEITESNESADVADSNVPEFLGADLFELVYAPYVSQEESREYFDVQARLEALQSNGVIKEPEINGFASITVYPADDSGDYVFFAFLIRADNHYAISVASYHSEQKNAEVSLNNFSDLNRSFYDSLYVHRMGEQQKEVYSIDAQREFLFK